MTAVRKVISLVALLALVVPLICLSVPETTSAAGILTNGGFETGDFTGWDVTIPPGGAVQVVTRFDFPVPQAGTYLPHEGKYFALLRNGQQDVWTVVSQNFASGTMISGWAFFKTVDFAPWSDECKVEITVSSGGSLIATLFQASVLTVGNYGGTPWTNWSYTFTNAGEYTIQARVVNRGDSAVSSYVGLDGVSVYTTQQQHRSSPPMLNNIKPAQMSMQYLSVNPQQASANQSVTILTNVVNTGDEAGNYNVVLKINGQLETSRMVNVSPQATQPVKFTVTKSQAGTYAVDVSGQKGTFTILAAKTTSGPSVSSGAIVMLVMFVLIVSTIVVLLFTFRRPA